MGAAHHDHQGQAGPDPHHHRTRRQDHQGHRRPDRLQRRRRGRRHGRRRERRLGRREARDSRSSRGSSPSPRSGPIYKGTVHAHRRLRRVRRDPARTPTRCCTSPRSRTSAWRTPGDVLKEGDEVDVKVISVERDGKVRLIAPRAPAVPRGRGRRARTRAHPARARSGPGRRPWAGGGRGGGGRDRDRGRGGRDRDRGTERRDDRRSTLFPENGVIGFLSIEGSLACRRHSHVRLNARRTSERGRRSTGRVLSASVSASTMASPAFSARLRGFAVPASEP